MNKAGQKKEYSGWPGDCSEEQLQVLEQFQKFIKEDLGITDPKYDDHFLLRFLRARKFKISDAQKMFQDYINWRKENDVDNIKNFVFTEIDQVRQFYPHGYHMTDKFGRSIYIERIGMLQVEKLFQITSDERMIKYYIQSYELLLDHIMPSCSKVYGKRVDQTVTILDLKDVSLWSMPKKRTYAFIQLAAKLCQDNYPEIMGAMFIINAPTLFTGIWAVIKPWLDERTRAKIKILGSNYQKELTELIDEENLPDFLGGKSKIQLEKNIGPWNPNGKELFGSNAVPLEQLIQYDNQIQIIQEQLEQQKISDNSEEEKKQD